MRLGRQGVTLLELLVVLVFMGLLVAFAAPRIDVTKYQIESSMQGIGMVLLSLERQSIAQQHDIIVMFDTAKQSLRVHEDNNNNATVDAGERVRVIPLGEKIVFGRGGATAAPMGPGTVTFTKVVSGYKALVFHRDGSASEAAGFYLTSQRSVNYTGYPKDARAITVDRATGRASWSRYNGTTWVRAF